MVSTLFGCYRSAGELMTAAAAISPAATPCSRSGAGTAIEGEGEGEIELACGRTWGSRRRDSQGEGGGRWRCDVQSRLNGTACRLELVLTALWWGNREVPVLTVRVN